jgi:hypothetical protein
MHGKGRKKLVKMYEYINACQSMSPIKARHTAGREVLAQVSKIKFLLSVLHRAKLVLFIANTHPTSHYTHHTSVHTTHK